MPFVGCCALVYFWTLRFSRIGDFYTLRLGFFGNLDLRIIATESGTVTFAFNDSASALRIANTQQKFIPIFTFFSFIGDQDNQ